jgi:hypothetical protein
MAKTVIITYGEASYRYIGYELEGRTPYEIKFCRNADALIDALKNSRDVSGFIINQALSFMFPNYILNLALMNRSDDTTQGHFFPKSTAYDY